MNVLESGTRADLALLPAMVARLGIAATGRGEGGRGPGKGQEATVMRVPFMRAVI